jgi:hypothetical protein
MRLTARAQALNRPLSIGSLKDGGVYTFRVPPLVQTNLFFRVGWVDDVFIKIPSRRGLEGYKNFVRLAQSTSAARALEHAERFEELESTLERFSDLQQLVATPEMAHYLVVHKIQYERLRAELAVYIPSARFGALRSSRFLGKLEPVLFQERIPGTTLWEMFDFAGGQVLPRWRPSLPTISAQLSRLLDSCLLNHIDWNIHNFVFHDPDQRLFYVDLKPTTFVARDSNEHNLKGIREYFLV